MGNQDVERADNLLKVRRESFDGLVFLDDIEVIPAVGVALLQIWNGCVYVSHIVQRCCV